MKKQFAWAIVGHHKHIHHSSLRYTRRDVIEAQIKDWRPIAARWQGSAPWGDVSALSDAQLWRKLKRHYGWSVKRIAMRVIR